MPNNAINKNFLRLRLGGGKGTLSSFEMFILRMKILILPVPELLSIEKQRFNCSAQKPKLSLVMLGKSGNPK